MICNATARCNRPMWPPDVIARCNRPQQEAIANMDISYVDLWLALLRCCSWGRFSSDDDEERTEATAEGAALGPLSGLAFDGLTLPALTPVCLDPSSVKSFEDARAVYLKAASHAARAKAFFILDGFVTSHFDVLNREVSLYQVPFALQSALPVSDECCQ